MMIRQLDSVDAVIEALGGTTAVAHRVGIRPSAVSNWRERGKLAASTYLKLSDALAAVGCKASPQLWGINGEPASG